MVKIDYSELFEVAYKSLKLYIMESKVMFVGFYCFQRLDA